jgi:hypothetical protein
MREGIEAFSEIYADQADIMREEHTVTLKRVNNPGPLYADQGKMAEAEAEAIYLRALQGFEKVWGAEHTSALSTVNSLGNAYKDHDKMAEAMYLRALQGREKRWSSVLRNAELHIAPGHLYL